MAPSERTLSPEQQLTMFHASELELGETTKAILDQIEKIKPRRVVLDSLSEVRLLAQNPLRYRRQILALKQFFSGRQSTVLLLDDRTSAGEDLHLQSIAHGVICLEQRPTDYGAERRQVRVSKMRGVPFRSGFHDMVIRKGGSTCSRASSPPSTTRSSPATSSAADSPRWTGSWAADCPREQHAAARSRRVRQIHRCAPVRGGGSGAGRSVGAVHLSTRPSRR
jgi:KaiC/GvpD/RAD55 family RecA-like ATPase